MFSITKTLWKMAENYIKTFLAVYGVGLVVGEDGSLTISVSAAAITAALTGIRNYLKNK